MKVVLGRNEMSISHERDIPTIVLDENGDSSRLWNITEEEFKELGLKTATLKDVRALVKRMKSNRWNYAVHVGGSSNFAISGFEPWRVPIPTY